jgi:hypothetical protein
MSVNIVLGAMSQLHRQDRRAARARAKCELEAIAAGVELVNPSGVDWEYWEKRFAEMPISVRENTARREIIPLLLGRKSKATAPSASPSSPETTVLGNGAPVSAEDIRQARMALEERFSLSGKHSPVEIEDSTTVLSPAPAPVSVDMSSDDLEVLIAARARARARVNCG